MVTRGLQLESLSKLHTLSQCGNPGIKSISLLFKLLTFGPKISEGNRECLDELVVLKLGFRVLVRRIREIDRDVDHSEVSVAEAGV